MLKRGEALILRILEVILVILLGGMVVMVFGNVVLRYAFNSGIDISEELSRYFFVWLTYISAVVVMRENGHLGVDTLVGALSAGKRIALMVLSDTIVLICCGMLVWGAVQQHQINASMTAPVTGISMVWVNGILYFAGVGIAIITASRIVRAFTGRLSEREIAEFGGDYSLSPSHDLKGHLE